MRQQSGGGTTPAKAAKMVPKPAAFVALEQKGLIPPAMKVRGRDYLRILYEPDYDLPAA